MAHIIVVGNMKGGTGKSTVSMHLLVSLLARGIPVGSVDLDARQGTLSSYVQNRAARAEQLKLRQPLHRGLFATNDAAGDEAELRRILAELAETCPVIVVDTPGADNALTRAAHSFANTLVTPLNDSLVDLDVLAKVDPDSLKIVKPSTYSEMVWETRKQRALRGERSSFEWIVLRNRLAHLDARNKVTMEKLLADLAKRIGFRLIPGLGERVIYRELFLEGLTLLDLKQGLFDLKMSHVAARQELRTLTEALGLDKLADQVLAAAGS